jgi:Predicted transcriptional regulator
MAREPIALTKFETEVMSILWRLGEASVREVQEAIDRADRPAYTTVQTIVQRLEQKGAVRRTRKAGNALFFEPAITRKSVYRRMVEELLDLVGGSQPLVAHLVETGKLSLDDLRAIEDTASAAKAAKRSRK